MEQGAAACEEQLDAARKLIASLILVRKNYSLYPEGHVICMNALETFNRQMEKYLGRFGELKLEIERDQLIVQGEAVHSEPPEEGALPFTLYRDGLRWLAFTPGIQFTELIEFLRILTRYTMLSDEPEGDIVTDLWETQLPHIRYEVADYFWENEQEGDLRQATREEEKATASLREKKLADWAPIPDPIIDRAAIELSREDLAHIRTMVSIEEQGDPTAYLDALLDSLLQHHEKENFEIIIEIFEEEFKKALVRKDFDVTFKILKSLPSIIDECPSDAHWAAPLIEDFCLAVSNPRTISVLLDLWPDMDAKQTEKIMPTLKLLQPVAIPVLALILTQKQSVSMRDMLVEVIISLATLDPGPLESLLKSSDDKVMERLVHVFVRLKSERASKALVKLVRHSSAYVRQEAVKGLMQQGPACYKDVVGLIEDKDESIRHLVLKQMGQSRDQVAESLLLEYLEDRKFSRAQHGHVISCFTALGQCGSLRSIPFLQQSLMGRSWLPSFGKSAIREGAAIALSKLGSKQSQKVLDDAMKSLNPVLRRMARKYSNTNTEA